MLPKLHQLLYKFAVTLYTRVWIEMAQALQYFSGRLVTLYTRVWIEIIRLSQRLHGLQSPSTRGCGLKWFPSCFLNSAKRSPSTRGCGLKFACVEESNEGYHVTLYTRVWIEITRQQQYNNRVLSPSTRGCGLKYHYISRPTDNRRVTLYTRVWIEIVYCFPLQVKSLVTLYTRVWIEIVRPLSAISACGVTLYTRVWIEMVNRGEKRSLTAGHPLHEGVD